MPFHSSYLRGGIDTYRQFLKNKIRVEDIDPDQLVGKYIPNVIGRPFSVDRSFVEEVAKTTGSAPLMQMLEAGTEELYLCALRAVFADRRLQLAKIEREKVFSLVIGFRICLHCAG